MLGLGYYRPHSTTDFVAKFVEGKLRSQGQGKPFFYGPRTSIARVPTTEQAITFLFREATSDSQQLVVQGTCYVKFDPARLIQRYDFTINPVRDAYVDADVLERIKNEIRSQLQQYVREQVQDKELEEHMANTAVLDQSISSSATAGKEKFAALGALDLRLFVSGIEPGNKDLQKALEAKKREDLLSQADRAQADRHKAAAENQRELREYESETELIMEKKREELIAVQNGNLVKEAEAQAEASSKKLGPYVNLEPSLVFALALQELAREGHVGQLNISPDLLTALQHATNGSVRS